MLYDHAATTVSTVETQTASTLTSHEGQGSSSRKHPYGKDDPFPVQEATAQVAYPLHPAILVAQYSMPMGCGHG